MLRRKLIAGCGVVQFGIGQSVKPQLVALVAKEQVWISDAKWRAKPNGVSGEFDLATVLLFAKNGEFRMAECYLTKWNDVVSISEGDGFVRHVGAWRLEGDRISIEYALKTPTRLVAKPLVTGPAKRAFVIASDQHLIKISTLPSLFRPNRILEKKQVAYLVGLDTPQ